MSEIIKADDKAAAVFNMYRYPLSIAGMLYLSEIMAEVYLDVVVLSQMLAQTDYPQDPVVMARHIETAILIKKIGLSGNGNTTGRIARRNVSASLRKQPLWL